jgi:hypothetical protein
MNASEVTPSSFREIVFDPVLRRQLLNALQEESGHRLPLMNAAADAAEHCDATREQLAEMVKLLLPEDPDDRLLDWLVLHPAIPEQCLYELLDCGRCVTSLGHRRGPVGLLLRITTEHPDVEEAVLTLALIHYGPDPLQGERFLEFVREHLHKRWLRDSLRRSDHGQRIPSDRRAAALDLVERYEKQNIDPPITIRKKDSER